SFIKEPDIMSVWVDSGCSHYCVMRPHPELSYPADLYLEGDDQYQCWFQTSLWVAAALGDPAPYKTVVGHGFFVDDSGQKLSKSKGNIIDPAEVYENYGADVLRLWFTYADFRQKMHLTEGIFQQVAEAYRRIRNTARFLLANLQDFDPAADGLAPEQMREIDRWALLRLNRIVRRMTEAFDRWDLHLFYHDVHGFCANDLSAFYLNVLKDTLYTNLPDSPARRSAQTALWQLLLALTKMTAPVLTFTADEIWEHCRRIDPSLPISAQLADWPRVDERFEDEELRTRWDRLMQIRTQVSAALEQAKENGEIDQPLTAAVTIYAPEDEQQLLESFGDDLRMIFVASAAQVRPLGEGMSELHVEVAQAHGEKCERCWLCNEDIGISPEHSTLCPRCAQRVNQWPENQQ
ncbi:MAG: class I tRNA ligase family protein, partial [Armatimonadetes bacterium]|nr:class I tRNA ligase family protein [Armatimonadota bacterium]